MDPITVDLTGLLGQVGGVTMWALAAIASAGAAAMVAAVGGMITHEWSEGHAASAGTGRSHRA